MSVNARSSIANQDMLNADSHTLSHTFSVIGFSETWTNCTTENVVLYWVMIVL